MDDEVYSLHINLSEIQEGCILSADVFSRTNRPIIPKNTVITNLHISVLRAFNIEEVEIEKTLLSGLSFNLDDMEDEVSEENTGLSHLGLTDLFLKSVYQYKREFESWQAGLSVDIGKIRGLLLPLLDKMENSPDEVFNLYRYSTKETYMFQHSIAVGLICGFIGKRMNLDKGDWVQIALAGCLADCGMAKISPSILNKITPLTSKEYHEIKNHPVYSYKMVRNIPVLRSDVKAAILEHHERLDGSGYPLGEKEKRIPPVAKIIALADIYHAMTSERPYRSKQSPYKVLEMILEDSFGQFDINVLKILRSAIINFSTGDKVRLSDGRVAEVLFVDEKSPTRPLIKLMESGEIIQLEKVRNIYIDNVLV